MSSPSIPPPINVSPIDPKTRRFNWVWVRWFIDLVDEAINTAISLSKTIKGTSNQIVVTPNETTNELTLSLADPLEVNSIGLIAEDTGNVATIIAPANLSADATYTLSSNPGVLATIGDVSGGNLVLLYDRNFTATGVGNSGGATIFSVNDTNGWGQYRHYRIILSDVKTNANSATLQFTTSNTNPVDYDSWVYTAYQIHGRVPASTSTVTTTHLNNGGVRSARLLPYNVENTKPFFLDYTFHNLTDNTYGQPFITGMFRRNITTAMNNNEQAGGEFHGTIDGIPTALSVGMIDVSGATSISGRCTIYGITP